MYVLHGRLPPVSSFMLCVLSQCVEYKSWGAINFVYKHVLVKLYVCHKEDGISCKDMKLLSETTDTKGSRTFLEICSHNDSLLIDVDVYF